MLHEIDFHGWFYIDMLGISPLMFLMSSTPLQWEPHFFEEPPSCSCSQQTQCLTPPYISFYMPGTSWYLTLVLFCKFGCFIPLHRNHAPQNQAKKHMPSGTSQFSSKSVSCAAKRPSASASTRLVSLRVIGHRGVWPAIRSDLRFSIAYENLLLCHLEPKHPAVKFWVGSSSPTFCQPPSESQAEVLLIFAEFSKTTLGYIGYIG